LDMDDVQFDRVHRVGSKATSPIIARCVFFKDKVSILRAKQSLKGTDIFIGEDFSMGVRETRRQLASFIKDKRSAGHRVAMVHDHLLIDGKRWYLSENGNSLTERGMVEGGGEGEKWE